MYALYLLSVKSKGETPALWVAPSSPNWVFRQSAKAYKWGSLKNALKFEDFDSAFLFKGTYSGLKIIMPQVGIMRVYPQLLPGEWGVKPLDKD